MRSLQHNMRNSRTLRSAVLLIFVSGITFDSARAADLLELLYQNATQQIPESNATRTELQLVFSGFRDAACSMVNKPSDVHPDPAALTAYFLRSGLGAALLFTSGAYTSEPLYVDTVRLASGASCKSKRSQLIYLNLYRLLQSRAAGAPDSTPTVSASAPILQPSARLHKPLRAKYVAPEFDPAELGTRSQVSVILELLIDVDGKVTDVRDLNQSKVVPRALVDAAIKAVQGWEYEPTIVDGRHVRMRFTERVVIERP